MKYSWWFALQVTGLLVIVTVLFMELMAQWRSSFCRLSFEGSTSLQWRLTHCSPTGSPRSPLRPCQSPAAVNSSVWLRVALIHEDTGGRRKMSRVGSMTDALQDRRKSAGVTMAQWNVGSNKWENGLTESTSLGEKWIACMDLDVWLRGRYHHGLPSFQKISQASADSASSFWSFCGAQRSSPNRAHTCLSVLPSASSPRLPALL